MNEEETLINKLKNLFESLGPENNLDKYPKEALETGTYVRSDRLNKLGVITDAFYGELDADGKKIIIYTLLIFPNSRGSLSLSSKREKYYVTNEYEYEVTAFLMIKPMDLSKIIFSTGEGGF